MAFGSSLAGITGAIKQAASSAATQVVGDVVQAGQQIATNFNLSSKADKAVEALQKTINSGSLGKFASVTVNDNISYGVKQITNGVPTINTISNADINSLINQQNVSADSGRFQSDPTNAETNAENKTNELKVIIRQNPAFVSRSTNIYNPSTPDLIPNQVTFDVMPTIDESRQVNYDAFSPIHHPGEIQKYRGSAARTWTINAKLVARNREEARKNQVYLNVIRFWAMPFYGKGTDADTELSKWLGAPPPVLTLSAYGSRNIDGAACVLTSYNWSYPNDVDYLPTDDGQPFPVLINISLSLTETWAPAEFSNFDLRKFREGDLSGAMGSFNNIFREQLPRTQPSGELDRG